MYIVHYSVFSIPTVGSFLGSVERDIERVNNYEGSGKFNAALTMPDVSDLKKDHVLIVHYKQSDIINIFSSVYNVCLFITSGNPF